MGLYPSTKLRVPEEEQNSIQIAHLLTEGLAIGTVEAMEGLVLLVFTEAVGDVSISCRLGLIVIILVYLK